MKSATRPLPRHRPRRARAIGRLLVATLALLSASAEPGYASDVTPLTSLAELEASCAPGDFGPPEGFEGLIGEAIDGSVINFAIGTPATLFQFPSGIVLGGPAPNVDLLIIDLSQGSVRYTLGDNGDVSQSSMCVGGENDGQICSDDGGCPDGTCESQTGLPSGTAYAATNSSGADPVCLTLPPSDRACNAVGMYLSSFDGRAVTLTAFDRSGAVIGDASFDTEPAFDGFIGLAGSGDPEAVIRAVEISSVENFVFDDVWYPAWNDAMSLPMLDPELCPEPPSALMGLAALVALVTLASAQRSGTGT